MENENIEQYYKQLVDTTQPIGIRYQAVFQLKNINSQQAISKLVEAYPHLS